MKGDTVHRETCTSGCLPGNLKFLSYLGQNKDFQVSGLDVTKISQYKIPFYIFMTYPLAQTNST